MCKVCLGFRVTFGLVHGSDMAFRYMVLFSDIAHNLLSEEKDLYNCTIFVVESGNKRHRDWFFLVFLQRDVNFYR